MSCPPPVLHWSFEIFRHTSQSPHTVVGCGVTLGGGVGGGGHTHSYVAGELAVISTRHSEPSLHEPSLPQSTQPSSQVAAPVWKSTSELGYAWTFVSLQAIEPTRSRRQRRVDGVAGLGCGVTRSPQRHPTEPAS